MDVLSDAVAAVRLGRPSSDRLQLSGSWSVRLEPYDGAAFLTLLAGSCWLLPDDGPPIALGAGDVALLMPHGKGLVVASDQSDPARAVPFAAWRTAPAASWGVEPHGIDVLCGKYQLDVDRLHPLLAELPEVLILRNAPSDHAELSVALRLLATEQDRNRPGAAIALSSLLDLVLVHILRSWMITEDGGDLWSQALTDEVASAALRALHIDPAAKWTTESLAAEIGVSRPTLARRFTATIGKPPMAYLTWWRLVLAAACLVRSDATLAVVARRVGYGSPYALSHAFRRQYGVTPGRYRSFHSPTT